MPVRASQADTSGRTFGGLRRVTIEKINDDPKLQELDVNGLNEETKTKMERVQEWGYSSVPLSPSEDQGSGQSGGQGGQSKAKKYAMAIVGYFAGSRSHGVVLGVDDRRHRPLSLKEGESAQYDHQAQKVHITRTGIEISGGDDKLKQGDDGGEGAGGSDGKQQRKSRSKKLPIHTWTGDSHILLEKDKQTHWIGDKSKIVQTADSITFTVGKSSIKIEDGKITTTAETIVEDGNVKLGGPDADTPASMKGTIDTAGDADVSNLATKVLLK